MELSGLQIFKYLPGAKKSENTNCKICKCPTCMAFALKLAKGQVDISDCPYVPEELKEKFLYSRKPPQKTVVLEGLNIGGENVLYRHEKTFINPTALAVVVDAASHDFMQKIKRLEKFEITRVNEKYTIDLVILKNHAGGLETSLRLITEEEFLKLPLKDATCRNFKDTAENLINIRTRAIKEKDEQYADPVYVRFSSGLDKKDVCAKASYYICKYANMLVFEDFDEALFSTLITLRQNIFTDPQKPLQVEAKIYEFNNPDENSIIFMTTNFALTFFAVANELENLSVPSYLVVTPADGMSVLTAWSAEKFTAKVAAKTLKKFDLANKVKTRKIIIPGLLAHMKQELQEEIKDFDIVVGTVEAYEISDFVKNNYPLK